MAMATSLVILNVLVIIILTGWVSLWILKPTEIWKKSWHRADESVNATIFKYLGLDILVFSLPIITVSILGLLYQHLTSRVTRIRQGRISISKLSNPIIARSPLGVTSTAELLTATLFIFFLAWTSYSYISSDLRKMVPIKSEKLNQWQAKVMRVGVRFGALAEACLALLLFPVLRAMALFRILGLQFEVSVRYHVWLGSMLILFSTLHGSTIMFIWGTKHNLLHELPRWQKTGRVNLAGVIALAAGLIIWVTSLPWIRRKKFELFYYTHHLYTVFLVFFLFHAGDRHFYTVFPGVFLFCIDKLLRFVQSRPTTCLISARIYPCKAVELVLPKHPSLQYASTSIIFIKIPRISSLQWHPFSISSSTSMDNDRLSVIAKCQGQWTNALYNMLHDTLDLDAGHTKCLPVAVEGPYGPLSDYYLRYESLVLIAGGSGITPFLSILQDVISINSSSNSKRSAPKMQLIYVVKKSQDLSILNAISPLLLKQLAEQGLLKLKLFVTQEQRSGTTVRELLREFSQVQTVCFDTTCSKYTIPKPESLLWMATVTGLSIIIFLVSLGCLNHALHSEQKKKPSSIRDMCVICAFLISTVCITLATALLRWRKSTKEIQTIFQTQDKRMALHLLEKQNGLEEHEIHFGQRPDFQDIFSRFSKQMNGCNAGVLVCGPESLQETVASLCRSNARSFSDTENKPTLSFHSLNFAL